MARNPNYTRPEASAAERAMARKQFGDNLRVMMNQRHWTQSDMSRQSGIARDAISNYVRGISFPDPGNLKRLAKTLDTECEALIPTMAPSQKVARKAAPIETPKVVPPEAEFIATQVAPDRMEVCLRKTLNVADVAKIIAIISH